MYYTLQLRTFEICTVRKKRSDFQILKIISKLQGIVEDHFRVSTRKLVGYMKLAHPLDFNDFGLTYNVLQIFFMNLRITCKIFILII